MDFWRLNPTPYGAYSNAESINRPVTELPEIGISSSAAPATGSISRFTVSHYCGLAGSNVGRPRTGHSRHDGIDWDRQTGPVTSRRPGPGTGAVTGDAAGPRPGRPSGSRLSARPWGRRARGRDGSAP